MYIYIYIYTHTYTVLHTHTIYVYIYIYISLDPYPLACPMHTCRIPQCSDRSTDTRIPYYYENVK